MIRRGAAASGLATTRQAGREDGFALVTAVVAMALLSLMALAIVELSRGHVAGIQAEFTRARLRAASDAGLAYAIRQLSLEEHERRWSIDARSHHARFDGADLTIAVEDEAGKIPLNQISDDEARTMFATLGLAGDDLDAVTDAFLDWRDPDDDVRPHGAEARYYAPLGRAPRNGPLRSLDELSAIRGTTPSLLERLRPAATVFGGEGQGFDARYAQPLALRVMGASEATLIERTRELAGERPALPLDNADTLVARALTIRVVARVAGGAYARATVIQFTGTAARPWLVRLAR